MLLRSRIQDQHSQFIKRFEISSFLVNEVVCKVGSSRGGGVSLQNVGEEEATEMEGEMKRSGV